MITYSVNGQLIKNNTLSKKSNKIIERMTQEETELNMAGSLNVSGTVKASKFMTADGTIIDITNTNNKIQVLQESIVTPQEHRDLRDEMLKADQEFVNKSEMDDLEGELATLKSQVDTNTETATNVQNIQGVSNGILVHERIIWGTAGQTTKSYGTSDSFLCQVYNPFGYAVPTKNSNTTRKYRIYAIYSDGMTTSGQHTITFNIGNWGGSSKQVSFNLPRTWGTTSNNHNEWNRDSYSTNWVTESDVSGGHHGKVYVRVNGSGTQKGVLRHLVLQSWDFPN